MLLDNFIQASAQIEDEERDGALCRQREEARVLRPLDPLLERLSRDYASDEDLAQRLLKLFQVIVLLQRLSCGRTALPRQAAFPICAEIASLRLGCIF